jgi:hypothetical protein
LIAESSGGFKVLLTNRFFEQYLGSSKSFEAVFFVEGRVSPNVTRTWLYQGNGFGQGFGVNLIAHGTPHAVCALKILPTKTAGRALFSD